MLRYWALARLLAQTVNAMIELCAYRCSRRLVGEPLTGEVWLQWLGCFFLSTKKKFHCADGALAGNGLRRLESQGAAGLKKRLPVLPMARWRALITYKDLNENPETLYTVS